MRSTENNDCARDAAKVDIAVCFWVSKIKVFTAAAIESLLLDKQKRTEMGTLATARAQALFSVDRMINAHIELYKSIVK
jgi:hypothetical protein